jgi:glycosyltransferase involved in cell wall biosynthesis
MTRLKKELSIIIPSYNEINNLKYLIKKTNLILQKNKNLEIIIVDNGSTDGSKNYIENNKKFFSKIKFVRVKKNIGYGYGIKYGLKFATGKIISWTHADLQFDINDIIKFFYKNYNLVVKQNLVVKGKRQNRTFTDNFFTNGMSVIVNFLFNIKIKDINGQPKIFNNSLKKKILKSGPNDFSLDLFLLLLASKNNLIINEFPLKVKNRVNDKAKGGGSILGKIKLTINTFKYILILYFSLNRQLWKL